MSRLPDRHADKARYQCPGSAKTNVVPVINSARRLVSQVQMFLFTLAQHQIAACGMLISLKRMLSRSAKWLERAWERCRGDDVTGAAAAIGKWRRGVERVKRCVRGCD